MIILASTSPRRKEILGYFSLPFKALSPQFDEEKIPFDGDPVHYVKILSEGKALSLAKDYPESLILGADTSVFLNNKVYNKPKDWDEAYQTLSDLSGNRHTVCTSVTGVQGSKKFTCVEETYVSLHPLSREEIEAYINSHSVYDKSGGYTISGSGGIIVQKIEGCYYNVVGLPINGLLKVFRHFGINLWDSL